MANRYVTQRFTHTIRAFRNVSLITAFALLCSLVGAQASITSDIDTLLNSSALKGGYQGVIIQSLKDGKTWYEHNPEQLFLPASNQKIITGATAFALLGPDWRYNTKLLRTGSIDSEGVLHGNLYLVGNGDPTLTTNDLDSFATSVKDAGIKRIDGCVYGDDTRFDRERYGASWCWDDMPYYYSAQISALNLNENLVTVYTSPGAKPGDPVQARVEPEGYNIRFKISASTSPEHGKSEITIGREIGKNTITVDGSLAIDAKPGDHAPELVTIEDPTGYTISVFRDRLKRISIETKGPGTLATAPKNGIVELANHQSTPMSDILSRLNKPSDNLIAECLLKTLGAEKGGSGTAATGAHVVMGWLKPLGIDSALVSMADGSGLSRKDLVTPRLYAAILKAVYNLPKSSVYIDSLPIAGVDGSLRNRMKNTAAQSNCHAKTGYISRVSSLSGYVTTKDGEPLLFTILMNNHLCANSESTHIQDKIVTLLANSSKPVDISSYKVAAP